MASTALPHHRPSCRRRRTADVPKDCHGLVECSRLLLSDASRSRKPVRNCGAYLTMKWSPAAPADRTHASQPLLLSDASRRRRPVRNCGAYLTIKCSPADPADRTHASQLLRMGNLRALQSHRRGIAVADSDEGCSTSSESRSCSDVQGPSSLESNLGGIMDVIGNSRALDSLKGFGGDESGRFGGGEEGGLDWKTDERMRRSCEAGTSLRVAVLVSGGVDSSVALRLLCEAGHSCTAFYLKIWFQEDFENFWSACPWEEDLSFAQDVCDEAGVELKVVHLTDAYWGKVVLESILEIQAGRTPNPDMLCNSKIKFGAFLDHVKDEQFDRVASGHYALVKRVTRNNEVVSQLQLSADEAKDQTYFLSQLLQSQLSQLMFPLGELSKAEVREVAGVMGLANKQRKDSQGICFLGKVKFREFVGRHLGEKEGCLLEAETGAFLGTHKGFWFYTVGQRQGIGLSNGPWFVVAKDMDHNVVFISRKYYSEKTRRQFRVGSFNWVSGFPPSSLTNLLCKVRHGPQFYECTMEFDTLDWNVGKGSSTTGLVSLNCLKAVVTLAEDDQGLAPGQYAAFYQRHICLGSGIILEGLGEEKSRNVSLQALETAKICSSPEFLKKREKSVVERRFRPVSVRDGSAGPVQMQSDGSRIVMTNPKAVNTSKGSSQNTGLHRQDQLDKLRERTDTHIWSPLFYLEKFLSWIRI